MKKLFSFALLLVMMAFVFLVPASASPPAKSGKIFASFAAPQARTAPLAAEVDTGYIDIGPGVTISARSPQAAFSDAKTLPGCHPVHFTRRE